jgi:hypothetical protein
MTIVKLFYDSSTPEKLSIVLFGYALNGHLMTPEGQSMPEKDNSWGG